MANNMPAQFDQALAAHRPELHRYLARMTGSVIDGEDLVQDTLLAATRALAKGEDVTHMRGWLFRIAHNTALNAIRARKSEAAMKETLSHQPDTNVTLPLEGGTRDALLPYLGLTAKQRSAVILRDVFGHTTAEVADLTGLSQDATKSALKRGRAALATADIEAPVEVSDQDKARLATYAAHFNAHAFDALRDMLAREVHLDLVSVEKRNGQKAVGGYFGNYARQSDWLMAPGLVEGRPAILAFNRDTPGDAPQYFIHLNFDGDHIAQIRDFRYARYAMDDAHWVRLGS